MLSVHCQDDMSTKREIAKGEPAENTSLPQECFVIMPISDQPNYDPGHFGRVYEDIFRPACVAAGYEPKRADDVKQSNLIHLDILKRVVNSPMAICDLSGRNPNVLFELGLRQAFDKPTILVKDADTPDIFDIAPIRYTTYHRELRYREVLFDQKAITQAILATRDESGKPDNVNSLIRLLELSGPAKTQPNGAESDPRELFQILMAEISQLKRELRNERAAETPALQSIPLSSMVAEPGIPLLNGLVASIQASIQAGKSDAEVDIEIRKALRICEEYITRLRDSIHPYKNRRIREASEVARRLEGLSSSNF